MKTFVVLCALACSTLAAPRQLDQSQRNWQSREKKSPTFGSHLDSHGHGLDRSYHHGLHQPQFHHEHLGLKKPFHHGYHDIHHSLGHGLAHHGHGFRSEEEEKSVDPVTEVTELKSADDINENLETGLESNINMARVAVDNMRRDLAEMESTANAKKQWNHSDSKSDTNMHDNIETAKEALKNVQTSFHNLQAMNNNKKPSGKDAESNQDAELEKMTEEERMAKWKSAIETIQKNVEIANNIKESLTSGKAEEQDLILPNHEARSSMMKPVIVEAHKKPNIDKKSDSDMQVSSSTKVEMRDSDDTREGEIMKEKSSWHHKTELKAVAPAMEKHAESPLKVSDEKESLKHETFKNSMKESEKEVLSKNGEKHVDSFEMEEQKSVDVKATDSIMTTNKEHMKMHEESHVEPAQIHEIKKAREDIEFKETVEKSAHHDTHLHPKKTADGIILNTKATRKFGSEGDSHHGISKQTQPNMDHHDKSLRQQGNGKSANIDTTTLMEERDFDAQSSMKESDMKQQASEMKPSSVLFEKENMDETLKHDKMKSDKSIDTATHPNMEAAMRAAESIQKVKDQEHQESGRSYGPASYGPSVAVSAPSYGPSGIVSGGYGAAAPSYGPSAGLNLAAGPASHSYGAPVSSYGSGAAASSSGSGISINLGGSGPSGAVGVFPNARIGGCAVPLLLSCSPSVVSGSLAKAHPSYSASYGHASSPGSYKTNEQLSSHSKRDVKINKLLAKKARRSFSPILA